MWSSSAPSRPRAGACSGRHDFDSLISLSGRVARHLGPRARRRERAAAVARLHLGGAEADEPPARAQTREALPEAAAADRIEDQVDRVVSRRRRVGPRPPRRACGSTIGWSTPKPRIASCLPKAPDVVPYTSAHAQLRDLRGRYADPARRRLDQHALALAEPAVADSPPVGRPVGHGRRALRRSPAVWSGTTEPLLVTASCA